MLALQRQFDEQLLQLLIAIIDAKLLKAATTIKKKQTLPFFVSFEKKNSPVLLHDFTAVDVEQPHDRFAARILHQQGLVDSFHQPSERAVIQRLA